MISKKAIMQTADQLCERGSFTGMDNNTGMLTRILKQTVCLKLSLTYRISQDLRNMYSLVF